MNMEAMIMKMGRNENQMVLIAMTGILIAMTGILIAMTGILLRRDGFSVIAKDYKYSLL
jgi:hypothetical protein